MLRKSKRAWLENELKQLEDSNKKKNTKKFYKKINEQNRTYKPKTKGIKNKEGKVVIQEDQFKQVWVEHFKELLTEEQLDEVERNDEKIKEENLEEPTLEEITEIIRNSKNSKAPGIDGIPFELIKYGGERLIEEIHKLMRQIWKEEKMPQEWDIGQIVTIHKKGDQQNCRNYRGITLLNTTYKILSTILQRRVNNVVKDKIGTYQCGFRKNKSTTDAIHILKQIMEKANEYKMELEVLFIDFKQAFDSIRRSKLMRIMEEMGVTAKLRRLIMMTLNANKINIKTSKGDTEIFEINKGVRQGDTLSALLFNITLEYTTRNINKGTLRTRGGQIIAYADDVVVITKRRDIMTKMLNEIITEGNKVGLKINNEKTKIMRLGKIKGDKQIKIGDKLFEEVDKFKYLGIMLTNTGTREEEIKEKIMATNRALHANKKILKSKLITKKTKIRIHESLIRPVMMYGAEVLTMTKADEENLRIAERKVMRTILGPIKINENEFRIRNNREINEELNGKDIVNKIKQQRLRWLGHVYRAKDEEPIKSLMQWEPAGKRRKGRPRSTWIKEAKEDLKKAGIGNPEEKAKDRKKWDKICRDT